MTPRIFPTAFLLSLLLSGCALTNTVTPDHVKDRVPTADSSVPPQYPARPGWVLFKIFNEKHQVIAAVMTTDARTRYNMLIAKYQVLFKELYSVELHPDLGVELYTDQFNNSLFKIKAQDLEYFGRLSDMEKSGIPGDSLGSKIGAKISNELEPLTK